jgi:hypothetical protein
VKVNHANVRAVAIGGSDPEVSALLKQLAIDGTFHDVATAVAADGTRWKWTVLVEVDAPGGANQTTDGIQTLKDGTRVRVLTIKVSTKDAAGQTSAAAEAAAGRHLFHEAHHALLIMDADRVSMGVAPTSQLFQSLQRDKAIAAKVGAERTALEQAMGAIRAAAGSVTPQALQGLKSRLTEFLVIERLTTRRTDKAFNRSTPSATIAAAYAPEIAKRSQGNTPAGVILARNLPGLISNFYAAMDRTP